jgi:hypothetical protein
MLTLCDLEPFRLPQPVAEVPFRIISVTALGHGKSPSSPLLARIIKTTYERAQCISNEYRARLLDVIQNPDRVIWTPYEM